MFCTKCGTSMSEYSKFCTKCGSAVAGAQPAAYAPTPSAQPYQQPWQPMAAPKSQKRRTAFIIVMAASALAVVLVAVLVVVPMLSGDQGLSASAYPPASAITGDNSASGIAAEEPVFETKQSVSAKGGVITIDNAGSPLNGLIIEVPENAYDRETAISVHSAQIISSGFDPHLTLISPLIHVDNGGEYADDVMRLKVPCTLPDDVIPVAFYYHEDEKRLEYIPVVNYDRHSVTMELRHFSTPVVGYFGKSYIEDETRIDTGFVPGVDDFSFVNKGSAITPRGNCFGESVAAIWYFKNMKLQKGDLHGQYDNYGKNPDIAFETKAFQEDDVLAYRLASVSQFLFAVSPDEIRPDWNMSRWNAMRTSDKMRYDTLLALMKFSGPQALLIQRLSADRQNVLNYHAIVAYRAEEGRIYVADPNNPGQKNRYIQFQNGSFQPYSSADNAQDLQAGNAVNYNVFSALGETAMFDFNRMRQLWTELEERTVGDAHFPEVDVTLTAKVTDENGEEFDEEITQGYISKGKTLTFVVDQPNTYSCKVFRTDSQGAVHEVAASGGRYTVELDKSGGYIGVALYRNNRWYDFQWVGVEVSDISGIYDVTGTAVSDWGTDSLTPFRVRVEQEGASVSISFLNDSGIVLKGIYQEANTTFAGRDPRPPGGDTLEAAFATTWWQLGDTVIVFDIGPDSITAEGELVAEYGADSIFPTQVVRITMIKVDDL